MEFGARGIRTLAVARSEGDDDAYRFAGLLTFLDPPRADTKDTIHRAYAYGVDVKMITGDQTISAYETARQLDMGDNITEPQGLPEFKARRRQRVFCSKQRAASAGLQDLSEHGVFFFFFSSALAHARYVWRLTRRGAQVGEDIPQDLGDRFGKMCFEADGFAQARAPHLPPCHAWAQRLR